jgi:hypothetical protein
MSRAFVPPDRAHADRGCSAPSTPAPARATPAPLNRLLRERFASSIPAIASATASSPSKSATDDW